jgi:hypothetical protein
LLSRAVRKLDSLTKGVREPEEELAIDNKNSFEAVTSKKSELKTMEEWIKTTECNMQQILKPHMVKKATEMQRLMQGRQISNQGRQLRRPRLEQATKAGKELAKTILGISQKLSGSKLLSLSSGINTTLKTMNLGAMRS